jgi:hypothetical protein
MTMLISTVANRWIVVLLGFAASAGCSSLPTPRSTTPVLDEDYIYTNEDVPSEGKFKLTLIARSKREVCTTSATWPSDAGRMRDASQNTFLQIGERRFAYRHYDMDVCPARACGSPIKNGMRLESSLFYQDFGIPRELYSAPKQLVHEVKPFWCDSVDWIDRKRTRD